MTAEAHDNPSGEPTPSAQPPRVGRFAFIEVGEADAGRGRGLSQMTVVAPALGPDGEGGRGDVTYWTPRGCDAATDLPVVVLLHGVYGSHWAWANKAGAHVTAQRLIDAGEIGPCVLAMPSDGRVGEGSGSCRGRTGEPVRRGQG